MIKKFILKLLSKHASKWVVLFTDLFLISLVYVLTYYIRFTNLNSEWTSLLLKQLPIVILIGLFSFLLVGSYKGIIRHTGTKDAFNVFFGVTILSSVLTSLKLLNNVFPIDPIVNIPRSILLIHYLISVFALVISRYVFKAFFETISTELKSVQNVLIFGAGDSGILTASALKSEKNPYDVVGFIDDDVRKVGKRIDRIAIFSSQKITAAFIKEKAIKEVIISIQKIKPSSLLVLTDKFLALNLKVKIVPPLSKWIEGDLQVNQIKQINIDDLLGRDHILINNPIVKKEMMNTVVLVTGAAGSIGSEITRQLSIVNLKQLVLIDQAESPLYDLQQELLQSGIQNIQTIVADVKDQKRMLSIFEKYRPQKVFHAAAYKHVPLMEDSPYEAVKVNVLGTKIIADLSVKYKVARFVMISTDKAVNPTNVMGATKRVAEKYISCLSKENNDTKFTITRFGNVLGSNGSVIPLFKKQIEKGGPLTVTHKDITRFFMTIPEACKLVLEAGSMGVGGEIYIFDMGQSVKIFDMAKRMISLSGLKYPEEIDIKFTGLRPGEKLYEELLAKGEGTTPTYHEKILIAKSQELNAHEVKESINQLCADIFEIDATAIVISIKKIVPEFHSKNSIFEKLDIPT